MLKKIRQIRELMDDGDRFLVTSHIDPDGDAVGSAFALYWALTGLGKKPQVYLRDSVPYRYKFLPGPEYALNEMPVRPFDAIFVVDCGNLFRVGEGYERLRELGPLVNIDHHATNEDFGLVNMIDVEASATAEVLYRLFRDTGIEIDYNVAVNLYTGILTDTGSFRYENTGPAAFLICEKLLAHGVKPAYVSQNVYESHPKERFVLLGRVLNTLKTYDGDQIAVVHVTEEMLKATGSTREHTDGFVEHVREMRGVEVAVLLRQIEGGKYKVSMRSKGAVDVARVGKIFGGGGHRAAAGCVVPGSVEAVEMKVVEALRT